jgi:hypothetical protein
VLRTRFYFTRSRLNSIVRHKPAYRIALVTSTARRRCAFVFVVLAIATATAVALAERDLLPLNVWAIGLVLPGTFLRNIVSHGELGFQDWRDIVLTTVGSAGTFTFVFALLDSLYRRLRRGRSDAPVV